ncbi:MAG: glycosyltransferase family 2 protein, partial [Saprospiraceae bacterium]
MLKLSVAIMTFNEEDNIRPCLDAIKDVADEIYILDSFSTDKTVEIAQSYGARVEQKPFERYDKQRDYCIQNTSHEWVLSLDADEIPDAKMLDEIARLKNDPGTIEVYFCNRLTAIGNHFIYHGGWHPDWKARFFKKSSVKMSDTALHETILPLEGATTAKMDGLLLHYTNKDIHDRIKTINNHSSIAAQSKFNEVKKTNLFRIIIKPFGRFIADYFVKRGFLDGYYGFVVARTTAYYVFLREVKLKELWEAR